MANNRPPKTKKIKMYYVKSTRIGKFDDQLVRYFIHTQKSGGFWTAPRDLSQAEKVANTTTDKDIIIVFEINKQQIVIDKYNDLVIVFNGKTYKTSGAKPDEFDYESKDIKIYASQFVDNSEYAKDEYEGAV